MMRRGEYGRSGLSPLIATVLLIAFAAALGTMIMNWSVSGSHGEPEDACGGVEIQFQQVRAGDAVCYDTNSRHLKFVVSNIGTEVIDVMRIQATNAQFEVEEKEVEADMRPGSTGPFSILYETSSPTDVAASITPVLRDGEELRACPDKRLEKLSIPPC